VLHLANISGASRLGQVSDIGELFQIVGEVVCSG